MIRINVQRTGASHTLLLGGCLAIGLVTRAAVPALAQNSGSWNKTGSTNTAREDHSATLLQNGQVLVAGGANGSYLTSAELYSPSPGKWTVTGSMNTPRYLHTATLLQNGQVLVAGGANAGGNLAAAELYDPVTGTWTVTESMSTARVGCTATLLPNGQVLVAGGEDSNSNLLASAELYNPTTGIWTATRSMNTPRYGHVAILLTNGQVLVAGSQNGAITAELYNPATGTWAVTGNLNFNRYDLFEMLLPNGDALVLDAHSIPDTNTAELYNPSTGTWTFDGRNTTAGNTGRSVSLLGTGMVLTAGGLQGAYPHTTVRNACDLFDPSTGDDMLTGSMHSARNHHTATVLQNGEVLAAGGHSQNQKGFFITNGAELYTP